MNSGKYPNTFYRVSIKAIIRNQEGKVLVLKEHQNKWELPGGGIDHGESCHDCLRRELKEELNITNDFTETFNKIETQYMPSRPDKELDFWKMSIYFDVVISGNKEIGRNSDVGIFSFEDESVLNELYG
jgi:mutator protein MutT